jgi:hypothetical protein
VVRTTSTLNVKSHHMCDARAINNSIGKANHKSEYIRMMMSVCSACGKQIRTQDALSCQGCRMFRFCCKQHLDMYIMQSHTKEECSRCREHGIDARENGFYTFPFEWYPQETFTSRCDFYKHLRLHGTSPYTTDCECISLPHVYTQVPILKKAFAGQSHVKLSSIDSIQKDLSSWWGEAGNALILECDRLHQDDIETVYNWETYVEHKRKSVTSGVQVDTRLAMLLDIPLTLFWSIKRFLRNCDITGSPKPKELKIILAGPEREHNQWPMLLELCNLLDGFDFDITMVGPQLPSSMHDTSIEIPVPTGRNMKISFQSAELVGRHAVLLMNCDIVCALNAGLGAYPNWMETISNAKLFMGMQKRLRMFFFTDYVDESIQIARKNLYMLFGQSCLPGFKGMNFLNHQDIQHVPNWRICAQNVEDTVRITESLINPFRKPLACLTNPSHLLPYAPNGFGCYIEVRR